MKFWPDRLLKRRAPDLEAADVTAVVEQYDNGSLCGITCSSSSQVHARWSFWHLPHIGFPSSHLTLRLRQVKQPF